MNCFFIGDRPAVNLKIGKENSLPFIVDTGFTGDLMVCMDHLKEDEAIGSENVKLANGHVERLPFFLCPLEWFGKQINVEAYGVNSDENLIGMRLLKMTNMRIRRMDEVLEITRWQAGN